MTKVAIKKQKTMQYDKIYIQKNKKYMDISGKLDCTSCLLYQHMAGEDDGRWSEEVYETRLR